MGATKFGEMCAESPTLYLLWEEYEACRQTSLIEYRRPEGKNGDESVYLLVWPQGFSQLPYEGGWEDQPYYYTKIFLSFLKGEQQGVLEKIK